MFVPTLAERAEDDPAEVRRLLRVSLGSSAPGGGARRMPVRDSPAPAAGHDRSRACGRGRPLRRADRPRPGRLLSGPLSSSGPLSLSGRPCPRAARCLRQARGTLCTPPGTGRSLRAVRRGRPAPSVALSAGDRPLPPGAPPGTGRSLRETASDIPPPARRCKKSRPRHGRASPPCPCRVRPRPARGVSPGRGSRGRGSRGRGSRGRGGWSRDDAAGPPPADRRLLPRRPRGCVPVDHPLQRPQHGHEQRLRGGRQAEDPLTNTARARSSRCRVSRACTRPSRACSRPTGTPSCAASCPRISSLGTTRPRFGWTYPRSIWDRYGAEMPARRARARSDTPRASRSALSSRPRSSSCFAVAMAAPPPASVPLPPASVPLRPASVPLPPAWLGRGGVRPRAVRRPIPHSTSTPSPNCGPARCPGRSSLPNARRFPRAAGVE